MFDVADLFGLAVVEFLRPKAATNDLLHAAFQFWHSRQGKTLLDAAREGRAAGVIVFDEKGNVTIEHDVPLSELVRLRKSSMLHVVEPNALAARLFQDVAMYRMTGDHAQPNPSGREPRKREEGAKRKLQRRSSRNAGVAEAPRGRRITGRQ